MINKKTGAGKRLAPFLYDNANLHKMRILIIFVIWQQ